MTENNVTPLKAPSTLTPTKVGRFVGVGVTIALVGFAVVTQVVKVRRNHSQEETANAA